MIETSGQTGASEKRIRIYPWIVGAVAVFFLLSLSTWWFARDRLPDQIRIATGLPGGMYYHLGEALKPHLEYSSGSVVSVLTTEGSQDNLARMLAGDAELGIFQAGSVSMRKIEALAPLYKEPVFVLVRRESGIKAISGLRGKRISVGPEGSGMRRSALSLLKHYGLDKGAVEVTPQYFMELEDDQDLDGAIVTTSLINPDLEKLLATGDWRLLPVTEAKAVCVRNADFRPVVPAEDIPSVATFAFLGVRADGSRLLAERTLEALYEGDVRETVPTLMGIDEVLHWRQLPMHPTAKAYVDPYGNLTLVATFMESLAGVKELLFALCAGVFLVWDQWKRRQKKRREREIQQIHERLDELLAETIKIEREQMTVSEKDKLKEHLDQVTKIKLAALEELSHEDLRSNPRFLIFMTQCGHLIDKIQRKILDSSAGFLGRFWKYF